MTIDEAIEHAEDVANGCDGECSEEHRQLAEWLRELRRARMEIDLLKTLRDEFRADAQKYKAENDNLRESAKLNDGTISTLNACIDDLNAETFKLRELVSDMWICVSHGSGWDCTGCRRDPNSVCIMGISEFSQRMRDLGIETER